jgi:DNA-binding CsgD family transcriptional regulator
LALSNPAVLRCEADLVEALVRLGRHREATDVLHRLEARSLGMASAWLSASLARCHAMLADGDASVQLFRRALEQAGRPVTTFERARTLMCYSERLKAFGRSRDAKDALLMAKVLFDEVGADAWTQRTDALLLDDRRDPPRGNPALLLLEDHERELAKMVARGMRNKEIAGTLFVSVRTVEVRLTAIYRKLGVESRAQLTALSTGRPKGASEPYVLPIV